MNEQQAFLGSRSRIVHFDLVWN